MSRDDVSRQLGSALCKGTGPKARFRSGRGFLSVPHYFVRPSGVSFSAARPKRSGKEPEGSNIPFFLLRGDPGKEMARLLSEFGAGALVSDFSPYVKAGNGSCGRRRNGNSLLRGRCPQHLPCWFASPNRSGPPTAFVPSDCFLIDFPNESRPCKRARKGIIPPGMALSRMIGQKRSKPQSRCRAMRARSKMDRAGRGGG